MRHGVQLYKCMACGHQFRGKVYLTKEEVWEAYREQKQTVRELSASYGVSESTIKRLLKDVSVEWKTRKCYNFNSLFRDKNLSLCHFSISSVNRDLQ